MTTLDVTQYTMRCGKGSHCRHPICGTCGHVMRTTSMTSADHPGTRQQSRVSLCNACYRSTTRPEPRHLTDKEMSRIRHIAPQMYDWHMERRQRLNEKTM